MSRLLELGLLRKPKAGFGVILMYHGVDKEQNVRFNRRFVGVKNFKRQMIYLKKYFHVVSVSDFIQGNIRTDKFNVAITFDDGYANNYKYAFPILQSLRLPATFYVTGLPDFDEDILWADLVDMSLQLSAINSININGLEFNKVPSAKDYIETQTGVSVSGFLKNSRVPGYGLKLQLKAQLDETIEQLRKNPVWHDYWVLMSNDQVIDVSRSGIVEIASHGYYHNNLGCLETVDAVEEVMKSKNYLENLIQREVRGLAYPDGSYTPELSSALHRNGITEQLAVHYLYGELKHVLAHCPIHRYGIEADGGIKYFWFLSKDSGEWVRF